MLPQLRPKSIPPPINIQVATSIAYQHISIVDYPKELLGAMPPPHPLVTYTNQQLAYHGPHQLDLLSFPNTTSQSDASPHKPTAGPNLLINLANPLQLSSHRGVPALHSQLKISFLNSMSAAPKYSQSTKSYKRCGRSWSHEGDFLRNSVVLRFLYLNFGTFSSIHTESSPIYSCQGHRASLASYYHSSALQVPFSLSASPMSTQIQ